MGPSIPFGRHYLFVFPTYVKLAETLKQLYSGGFPLLSNVLFHLALIGSVNSPSQRESFRIAPRL